MYLDFFKLKQKPFTIKSDNNVLYMSPQYTTAFALLQYGIENCDGFTVITGEVGCGKTTLCGALIRELNPLEYIIISLSIPPQDERQLLNAICLRLDLPTDSGESIEEIRDKITEKLRRERSSGKRTVLIIDESQNLDFSSLETVRLLSNIERDDEKLLHIILVGQPELKEKLRKTCMRQLRQRISVYHDLKPLSFLDTKNYIFHRINLAREEAPSEKKFQIKREQIPMFSFFALRKIYTASRGIPRVINNICDKALISAFIDYSTKVRLCDVRRALKDINQLRRV
ncbi:MAG: AAA family ATPase [Puniceicoccales bacterium]|jgi:general secretion pathway protein A|nr:AAA family ATPase [Puniceicoccales bacterium]